MPPPRPRRSAGRAPARRGQALGSLSERDLLRLRLCDLGLQLQGSRLQAGVDRLHAELAARGLSVRPHVWLSSEWFSPDDVPGFAIPFFLADPRLAALEARQMGEVEGGTPHTLRQLLRHEAGHALDSAYRLHGRREWRERFGRFEAPYTRHYRPMPHSKRFVRHLKNWYAQSHPAEDFAETVAVWLDPDSNWRIRYRKWPAIDKLVYVDELMGEMARIEPEVGTIEEVEPLSELTLTLGEYYEAKRRRYQLRRRQVYGRDLRRLFPAATSRSAGLRAATYLRRERIQIRALVASATGAPHHAVDRILRGLIERSTELELVVGDGATRAKGRQVRKVAAQVAQYLAEGHDRFIR